ncbi:MAG: transposase [Dysgonamonadaceae bacterium]|nr:transposase [Dysgonamonadaceae bacterium]MDY0215867.1 transposase [Bacteroidales bacterium]
MRNKRSMPTIVEQAILSVDGFEKVYKTFEQQVILKGQSKSTLHNYIRRIALISLHFRSFPEFVSDDEINELLTSHIIKYLGQYTHRVAISNQRILDINDTDVKFLHKDYRDDARQKPTSLPGVEFLRRFCQHILPKGFVKIRYYGIYSSKFRAQQKKLTPKMVFKPKETSQERLKRLTGFDACMCPYCIKGIMQVVEKLPRIRSPCHLPFFSNTFAN